MIAGASASASSSRHDEEKTFYFEINHPQCMKSSTQKARIVGGSG